MCFAPNPLIILFMGIVSFFKYGTFAAGLMFFSYSAAFAEIVVKRNCDIPGNRLERRSVKKLGDCQAACAANAACLAFTFVEGWGRCELKKTQGRQFNIIMTAGEISIENGKRTIRAYGDGWDNLGKDYLQAKNAKSVVQCETACRTDKRCQAYAFIQGYHLCWLKKEIGKKIKKTFYCGVKSSAK